MPKPFQVPASGAVEYQYFPIATGFKEDRWIQAVEVRPGNRKVVHHIVVLSASPARPGPVGRQSPTF